MSYNIGVILFVNKTLTISLIFRGKYTQYKNRNDQTKTIKIVFVVYNKVKEKITDQLHQW
jgi:hypothetical protein